VDDDLIPCHLLKINSKLAVIDCVSMCSCGGNSCLQELCCGMAQEPKAGVHVWCQHDAEEHFCKGQEGSWAWSVKNWTKHGGNGMMQLVAMEQVVSGGRRAVSVSSMARIAASEGAGHSCDAVRVRAGTRITSGTMLGPDPSPRRARVVPASGWMS